MVYIIIYILKLHIDNDDILYTKSENICTSGLYSSNRGDSPAGSCFLVETLYIYVLDFPPPEIWQIFVCLG